MTRTHGDFLNPDLEDYAFDIDEANRLLDEAGYEDADGDGVRECLPDQDCDGDLTFRLNFPDDSDTAPREAEQLQDTWNQVGVAVQIQGFDPDTLTSLCCPGFDFDVIIWSWYTDIDAGGLLGVATCAEIPSGFSETGYCNPEYDELFDAQAIELDRDTRIEQIHELQQHPRWTIVVYIVPYYFVVDPGLADGHVHRLDRGLADARDRGSGPARPAPTERVGRAPAGDRRRPARRR